MPKIEILDEPKQPREYTWEEIKKIPGLWQSTRTYPDGIPVIFLIIAGIPPLWIDGLENIVKLTDNSWTVHRFIPFKGKISIEWTPSLGGVKRSEFFVSNHLPFATDRLYYLCSVSAGLARARTTPHTSWRDGVLRGR